MTVKPSHLDRTEVLGTTAISPLIQTRTEDLNTLEVQDFTDNNSPVR
jgi:hypothetical protein